MRRRAVGAVVVAILSALAGVFALAYFIMLALGVLWSELHILKPLGYWATLVVCWAVSVLLAAVKRVLAA